MPWLLNRTTGFDIIFLTQLKQKPGNRLRFDDTFNSHKFVE